ncbi:MAG: hypothetical protein BWX80_04222 [Candidatus Hydrogenedentes bacterium ADurb.Bin101]|nr:MAG: hypothetical protein BWX80_04222 [Candidatus Hydrogenedentes bacterium ADurb.Bin101]
MPFQPVWTVLIFSQVIIGVLLLRRMHSPGHRLTQVVDLRNKLMLKNLPDPAIVRNVNSHAIDPAPPASKLPIDDVSIPPPDPPPPNISPNISPPPVPNCTLSESVNAPM